MRRVFEDHRPQIDVVFTGVRPGEKLYEEMGTDEENVAPTGRPKILIGKIPPSPPDVIEKAVEEFRWLADDGQLPDARLGASGSLVNAVLSGAFK